ncbi:MAG TPA: hypothetical protein VND93_29855, partial [Myxococcales bacterium]|nr:hypothetical protein [Myxococcales bacterium]
MTAALLLWLATAAAPSAPAEGLLAGRLAIFEDRTLVPISRVQQIVRQPLGLTLRRGRRVYDAQLDPQGYFVFRAPAGVYRVEYLSVGYRAEFFEPLELEVRGGALACAGTFSFSVLRLESLGNSNASRFSLSDDCERLMPYLRSLTGWTGKSSVRPPRHAEPEQVPRELTVADLLLGLRAEVSGNGTELAVRGWYVFPVFQGLGDPGALTLHLSGARLTGSAPGFGSEIALGAGLNLFGLAELVASGGVRLGFDGFPTEL